jgi:hypothetical protein
VLEVLQRELCEHVVVLPEAASILWKGGFPRRDSIAARKAAQRAIVRIQLELQRLTLEENHASLILCDRGTLDGLAYWPGEVADYFAENNITRDGELARYSAVIQLRPPSQEHGYQQTALRKESASEAAAIDERITAAWTGHPNLRIIESNANFLHKLERAIDMIQGELPACCQQRSDARLAQLRAPAARRA